MPKRIGLLKDKDWHLQQLPLEERIDWVRGIGPKTKAKLREEGYQTLVDVARHPKFGRDATRVWQALAKKETRSLLAAGARDVELLTLFSRDELVVVDIETVGLAQVLPIFLIGIAYYSDDQLILRQFLAPGFENEAAVLHQAAAELESFRVCISYNGKAFDEPFVRARLRLHGAPPVTFKLHVDLLHACRRRYADVLPNFRLSTVATRLFCLDRSKDISGADAGDLYFRYLRDGDETMITPVVEHNAGDLESLAYILEEFFFDSAAEPKESEHVS